MTLDFTACLGLASTHPDYAFAPEYHAQLEAAFARWLPGLSLSRIETTTGQAYALIALTNEAEAEITQQMFENPSLAWAMASLAYVMLRLKAAESLGASGCLPLPEIEGELAAALERGDLLADGRLKQRFSLLSFIPLESGCSRCSLSAECPRVI